MPTPAPEAPDPRPTPPGPSRSGWRPSFWHVLILLWLVWFSYQAAQGYGVEQIPYSEFKKHLAAGDVVSCTVEEGSIRGKLRVPAAADDAREGAPRDATPDDPAAQDAAGPQAEGATRGFETIRIDDPDLVKQLEAAGVEYDAEPPGMFGPMLWLGLLPLGLFVVLWLFMMRSTGATNRLSFGKSRARIIPEKSIGVKFRDVAGCEEAKQELREIVDFLRSPERFTTLGARIPKGVLLLGPPGTGKTLMARAVAGEASVPFFSISGSEFVEMFVGVGAARVRDLFEQAKAKAPCLIFVDEIDAIGRQRGVQFGAVNDEREQTLNQLLVEMDGFEANSGVILLAATNRPDVLDRALLRPGRFDRQVVLDAPDRSGREAILVVHTAGKPMADDVDLEKLARVTPGFSGADLANAVNEAALLAARRGHVEIGHQDLEDAVEKVVAGPERKSRRLNDEEKRRVAFHESGHAIVAMHSEHADPVHKITIVPRGRGALGYTMQTPDEETFLWTREAILDRVRGLLGGRAAEQLVFGEISTGAQNDLEQATNLVRQMVCLHGMSDAVGLMNCARREGSPYLQGDASSWLRDCSDETAARIDQEIRAILDAAYERAQGLLQEHREELEALADELLVTETLDRAAVEALLQTVRHRNGAPERKPSGSADRDDASRRRSPSPDEARDPR